MVPRKLTQPPAGDEVPRDHRHIAPARRTLPNVLVVAGIAEAPALPRWERQDGLEAPLGLHHVRFDVGQSPLFPAPGDPLQYPFATRGSTYD